MFPVSYGQTIEHAKAGHMKKPRLSSAYLQDQVRLIHFDMASMHYVSDDLAEDPRIACVTEELRQRPSAKPGSAAIACCASSAPPGGRKRCRGRIVPLTGSRATGHEQWLQISVVDAP